MKILFINLPYYGHIVPNISLVQQLILQGCEVTYMLPFGWENRIAGSGAEFYGYKNHNKLAEQIKNAVKATESIIADYDLIIYEQFFFLGKHLAQKYNKPAVRIFTSPATTKKLMAEYIIQYYNSKKIKPVWKTYRFLLLCIILLQGSHVRTVHKLLHHV